ncbi:MAG TPA: hypothetical protein VF543_19060 [Pyrinomonadaceae bacterium]
MGESIDYTGPFLILLQLLMPGEVVRPTRCEIKPDMKQAHIN